MGYPLKYCADTAEVPWTATLSCPMCRMREAEPWDRIQGCTVPAKWRGSLRDQMKAAPRGNCVRATVCSFRSASSASGRNIPAEGAEEPFVWFTSSQVLQCSPTCRLAQQTSKGLPSAVKFPLGRFLKLPVLKLRKSDSCMHLNSCCKRWKVCKW